MWIVQTVVSIITDCQSGIRSILAKIISDLHGDEQQDNNGIIIEDVAYDEDEGLCELFSSANNARPLPGEPFMVPVDDVEEGVVGEPDAINNLSSFGDGKG